jgi:PAS domain S-box-containing protein
MPTKVKKNIKKKSSRKKGAAAPLRRRAEKEMVGSKKKPLPFKGTPQELIHELQVHQVELEMQNEELRRAQDQLIASQHKYTDLYDFAPAGYFTFDRMGRVVEANLSGVRMMGVERAHLLRSAFAEFIAPEYRDVFRVHRQAVLQNGRDQDCELKLIRSDGSTFYASVKSIPVQGRPDYIRSAFLDITERKEAQERLEEEKQRAKYLGRISALLEISQEILAVNDIREMMQKMVDAARELTGARVGVARHHFGEGKFQVGASSRAENAPPCLPAEIFEEKKGGIYLELMGQAKSVRLSEKELKAHPKWWGLPEGHLPLRGLLAAGIVGLEGKSRGVIMVSDKVQGDFTSDDEMLLSQLAAITSLGLQHLEAKGEVQRRARELEAVNQELDAFTSSAAHDLKTPLVLMANISQRLAKLSGSKLDAKENEYLCHLQTTSRQMIQLVEGLLQFSRAGRVEMKHERVDLSGLAGNILAENRRLEPERQVETIVPEKIAAEGDPHLLRLALGNLLGNAWKFTRRTAQARIEFGNKGSGRERIFFVRDNGCGFNMQDAQQLFYPFQRLHKEEEYPGSGVGLATAKRIIERHGGRIWAESEEGKGATFYFTLPGIEEKPGQAPEGKGGLSP